jgi:hypothetical protein
MGRLVGRSLHAALHLVAPENDRAVLASWKNIAQYVSRRVRTVQRWERELGLPVRRTKSGGKGSVLAVPREIDAWVESQQFTDGCLDPYGSDRVLHELRIENRELRSENRELLRQLAKSAPGAHLIMADLGNWQVFDPSDRKTYPKMDDAPVQVRFQNGKLEEGESRMFFSQTRLLPCSSICAWRYIKDIA